jgi:hypothetical protein
MSPSKFLEACKHSTQEKEIMKRTIFKILGALVILGLIGFVVIQFIPVDRRNPPVVSEPNWDSPQTQALAERACFDCHSNETEWPAYAYVAPISWLVANDVQEGREKYNLSDWANNPIEAEEMIEEIEEGHMPLPNYVMLHPEARLSPAEKAQLITGLERTFAGQTGIRDNDENEGDQEEDDDDDGEKGAFFFER